MKNYKRSIEDEALGRTDEFPSGVSDFSRRDFLKASGFAVGAAALASCSRAPVEKAIPFLKAPEGLVPGRAYWLASTCGGCTAGCGVLVKCRDGRPIKLEGNPNHPVSRGGLCAIGQASVLELYDSLRLRQPLLGGRASTWDAVDAFVAAKLQPAARVRVLSGTLASPSLQAQIDRFLSRFRDGKHVVYDALSCSAIADAHEKTHGLRVLPRYRFDQADTILSLDADFLGTWISPVEYTKQYASRRTPAARNHHIQIEPRMSLTGSNADQRLRLRPDQIGVVLSHLLGNPAGEPPFTPVILEKIAQRLQNGRSLVVCGSNNVDEQVLTNLLNEKLGSYGTTIAIDRPSYQRQGNDTALATLVGELPDVDALFILGSNPVYDLARFEVGRVPLVVSFASHADETAAVSHVVAPDHHFLESWRDTEAVSGILSMTQPAIAPLGGTRAAIESFAVWSGAPAKAYDLVRVGNPNFEQTLSDGFRIAGTPPPLVTSAQVVIAPTPRPAQTGKLALVLYPTVQMLDGRHAHNPWLHELPDPVSKITWDNYASFSPATALRLGLKDGDVVRVNGVELPAFAQPGQHDDVVAVAIGYGRKGTDRFAKVGPQWLLRRVALAPGELVGKRVVQLSGEVRIEKTGKVHPLATTQLHSRLEGRDIVRETTLATVLTDRPAEAGPHTEVALWPGHESAVHQWAMAIDLTRCTGCAACVISCQAENNVPVVGKDEVLREREMHWMRIDRYYTGDEDVEVVHQPMLCHHCGNAPCESVCPVLATVHSSEGLNQQVYNRCVGTRYCANNCPYKARRFNWFDYPHDDKLQNMVLNPDVTVRSRGVMEKCSMCYQRIENAKLEAKRLGVPIQDGAVKTACQQSCPADAIVFGDLKDPKSRISAQRRDPRHYLLLEELNVKPAVGYLKVARASSSSRAERGISGGAATDVDGAEA